ncbi:hypothetical protein RFI_24651, partial [Reticulomyxa filosa]
MLNGSSYLANVRTKYEKKNGIHRKDECMQFEYYAQINKYKKKKKKKEWKQTGTNDDCKTSICKSSAEWIDEKAVAVIHWNNNSENMEQTDCICLQKNKACKLVTHFCEKHEWALSLAIATHTHTCNTQQNKIQTHNTETISPFSGKLLAIWGIPERLCQKYGKLDGHKPFFAFSPLHQNQDDAVATIVCQVAEIRRYLEDRYRFVEWQKTETIDEFVQMLGSHVYSQWQDTLAQSSICFDQNNKTVKRKLFEMEKTDAYVKEEDAISEQKLSIENIVPFSPSKRIRLGVETNQSNLKPSEKWIEDLAVSTSHTKYSKHNAKSRKRSVIVMYSPRLSDNSAGDDGHPLADIWTYFGVMTNHPSETRWLLNERQLPSRKFVPYINGIQYKYHTQVKGTPMKILFNESFSHVRFKGLPKINKRTPSMEPKLTAQVDPPIPEPSIEMIKVDGLERRATSLEQDSKYSVTTTITEEMSESRSCESPKAIEKKTKLPRQGSRYRKVNTHCEEFLCRKTPVSNVELNRILALVESSQARTGSINWPNLRSQLNHHSPCTMGRLRTQRELYQIYYAFQQTVMILRCVFSGEHKSIKEKLKDPRGSHLLKQKPPLDFGDNRAFNSGLKTVTKNVKIKRMKELHQKLEKDRQELAKHASQKYHGEWKDLNEFERQEVNYYRSLLNLPSLDHKTASILVSPLSLRKHHHDAFNDLRRQQQSKKKKSVPPHSLGMTSPPGH